MLLAYSDETGEAVYQRIPELRTPNSELRTPNSELRTLNSEL
jgi:hypothetical protein